MVNGAAAVLEPTYHGYVATTQDALILFEACLTGVLHHVPRRPHDRERSHLVRSGSVFIYEENSSGIKRWTDGVTWSPSRILGNFLVYRELDKPFPPGEKKRAMKKGNRRPGQPARPGEPYPRPESNGQSYSPTTPSSAFGDRPAQSDVERALVGSLVDSYGFKDSGLVKKTMSVTVSGVTHHLVSYYSVEDVLKGILSPPSLHEELRFVRPRGELTSKQSFRAPIDDVDTGLENPHDPSQALYGYRPALVTPSAYGMPNAHSDYYMHGSTYSHPSQPGSISAYPSGPLPPQTSSNPYLPSPTASSQMGLKPDTDHSSFRTSPYGTAFDSMSQNHLPTTLPPALNTTGLPNSLDRNRSHQTSSPNIYRNASMPSRSLTTDMTSPSDPSPTAASYSRGTYNLPGQLDTSSTQSMEQRNIAAAPFDPTIPRRDTATISSYYTGGADRQSYYPGVAHSNYPTAQPMSAWTTTAPAQPHM